MAPPLRDPMLRFLDMLEVSSSGCWNWLGAKQHNGYGRFNANWRTPTVSAHRWLYEQLIGKIPPGMHIDHKCRNRACTNPDHLEPVTQAENNRRAGKLLRMAAN